LLLPCGALPHPFVCEEEPRARTQEGMGKAKALRSADTMGAEEWEGMEDMEDLQLSGIGKDQKLICKLRTV